MQPPLDRSAVSPDRIDEGALLRGILDWVNVPSPTHDAAGVNRMMDRAGAEAERLGARVERRAGRDGFGDLVTARWPGADGTTEGGILLLGHVDTVHTSESVGADLQVRSDGDRVYGPGIYDMKGGLRAALHALEILLRAGTRPKLPVTFLFVPDEEVGSPSTRAAIEAEAKRHAFVLVPEPSHDGGVVTGRHAFQRFFVTVRGRPAHAGANNRDGRSAIRGMADVIRTIESFSDFDRGVTYSVGVVRGGQFVNVVPVSCSAQVLCVAPDEAASGEVRRRMLGLAGEQSGGISVEVSPGLVRPLFRAGPGTMQIYERARAAAAEVGLELRHGQFGGGSDGNFTGALGIPTLDGLGVEGGGLHTAEEHLLRSSLVPRCYILARLLQTLG